MASQRAVLLRPTTLRPGDRVSVGRGPWSIVKEVRPARGRPPTTGPNVVVVTKRREVTLPRDRWLRAVRGSE